jgi:hypothetical protein
VAVRAKFETIDLWRCIIKMLKAHIAADEDWYDCNVYMSFPDTTEHDTSKPIIYIEQPQKYNEIIHQGGAAKNQYSIRIGVWVDKDNGWLISLGAIVSLLTDFFNKPATIHAVQFTVQMGATTYTDTTLRTQNISILGLTNPIDINYANNEARKEVSLLVDV